MLHWLLWRLANAKICYLKLNITWREPGELMRKNVNSEENKRTRELLSRCGSSKNKRKWKRRCA
jgi:hypothetical protein